MVHVCPPEGIDTKCDVRILCENELAFVVILRNQKEASIWRLAPPNTCVWCVSVLQEEKEIQNKN